MDLGLHDSVFVVSGGTRGLGRATARSSWPRAHASSSRAGTAARRWRRPQRCAPTARWAWPRTSLTPALRSGSSRPRSRGSGGSTVPSSAPAARRPAGSTR
jgi:hypothetical protein